MTKRFTIELGKGKSYANKRVALCDSDGFVAPFDADGKPRVSMFVDANGSRILLEDMGFQLSRDFSVACYHVPRETRWGIRVLGKGESSAWLGITDTAGMYP